jgi:hypothetical protein
MNTGGFVSLAFDVGIVEPNASLRGAAAASHFSM